MKVRRLLNGTEVLELDKAIELSVYTKVPEKYKLIDLETGQEYVGYSTDCSSKWKKLN